MKEMGQKKQTHAAEDQRPGEWEEMTNFLGGMGIPRACTIWDVNYGAGMDQEEKGVQNRPGEQHVQSRVCGGGEQSCSGWTALV